MNCSTPGNSWSLLKLMSIKLVMPSNHLILCRPLLLSLQIFSSIRVFSSESALCIRWPKDWTFSFSLRGMIIRGLSSPMGTHDVIDAGSRGDGGEEGQVPLEPPA